MFCGCFVVFCGCFAVFCECFAAFPQTTQTTRKTSKNTEKHKKITIRSCVASVFKEQKNRLYCTKHLSQNICKTPQNTAKHRKTVLKRVLRNYVARYRKTITQNAQKSSHKTVAIQPQYVLRAFGVFFKNTLDLSQKYTMRNTRKLWGVSRTSAGGHGLKKNSVVRCFAVFCGVLRCFVCVFLAFFTKQTKTDPKIYKTHKTNKIRFVQYSAIRCCASFSHSENVNKKHSQNTSKTLQNIRKTPQNTAKHHKTDLLRKQTKLANKPLRSRRAAHLLW